MDIAALYSLTTDHRFTTGLCMDTAVVLDICTENRNNREIKLIVGSC